ncbi:MAG: hypothetical protein J5871_00650 [Bacteroidales bacterium]|nr:hypothetical protein [Bacteroidales bacterium]
MNARILLFLAALMGCAACEKVGPEDPAYPYNRVLLLYECGYNNLSAYFKGDIQDLCDGTYVPGPNDFQALLVFAHLSRTSIDYETPTDSHLIEIRKNKKGKVIRDTVLTISPPTIADPAVMRQILEYVGGHYKSRHYGLLVSSHGTGWMPDDSYNREPTNSDYVWGSIAPSSFGQERVKNKDYFINVEDLAEAIPFYLDYVLFDACLMGCAEVAYAFRDLAGTIGFSQAEVIGDGFIYQTLAERLLKEQDPVAAIRDVYEYYNAQSGFNQTAVVSAVNCARMQELAGCCAVLFEKYRADIAAVNPAQVQGFFTDDRHWFYDLEDILVQSGISEADAGALRQALDACVLYKAATPRICDRIPVRTNCGLSMYLPANGSEKLDAYYKTLDWNKATGLVK